MIKKNFYLTKLLCNFFIGVKASFILEDIFQEITGRINEALGLADLTMNMIVEDLRFHPA